MPKFGKWILTLGLVAATPHAALAANPFAKLFGSKKSAARQTRRVGTNQRVANEIARALRAARLNRFKMDVAFSGGVCTITGNVANAREKALVSRTISRVRGVVRVDNRLLITRHRAQSPSRVRTADYRTTSRIPRSGIQLASYQAPAEQQQQIQQQQPSAPPAGPSNQQVAESIGKALKSAGLTGYDMEIQYRDGVAALSGSVSSSLQRTQAEEVVRSVSGVQTVNNQLRVAGGQQAARGPVARTPRRATAPPQMVAPPQGYPQMQSMPRRVHPAAMYQGQGMPPQAMAGYQHAGPGAAHTVYNNANLPDYAWPTYASYPNYAQLTYPKQYSASAWPYIGPFYPYPQVPLGWRKATLQWDDGHWSLSFNSRTDRWWWFLNPRNWRSNPN